MARKQTTGIRKPMSPEAKAKIAQSVAQAAKKKRIAAGLPENGILSVIPARSKELAIVQMRDQKFDPSLFVPMPTGKMIDGLFTATGGIPKATNYLVVGDPGVGKSTVTMDMLADLTKRGHKCLFICAEMTRIDLYQYVQRYPKFGSLDILFLGEYLDDNPKMVVEEVLSAGYDIVLIDSFVEVQEAMKEVCKVTSNSAEKWLVDTMLRHNLGQNDSGKNTTFLAIQQVTKGGVFVGSNKLKHNTTGMMEIRYDDDNPDMTCIYFTKNRRGSVNQKVYFSLDTTGDVHYYTPQESETDEVGEDPIVQIADQDTPKKSGTTKRGSATSKENPFSV